MNGLRIANALLHVGVGLPEEQEHTLVERGHNKKPLNATHSQVPSVYGHNGALVPRLAVEDENQEAEHKAALDKSSLTPPFATTTHVLSGMVGAHGDHAAHHAVMESRPVQENVEEEQLEQVFASEEKLAQQHAMQDPAVTLDGVVGVRAVLMEPAPSVCRFVSVVMDVHNGGIM